MKLVLAFLILTITVVHNGVKIHDNVEFPKGTGDGGGKKEIQFVIATSGSENFSPPSKIPNKKTALICLICG